MSKHLKLLARHYNVLIYFGCCTLMLFDIIRILFGCHISQVCYACSFEAYSATASQMRTDVGATARSRRPIGLTAATRGISATAGASQSDWALVMVIM